MDQPDPIATDTRPVWEALIDAIEEVSKPLDVWPLMLGDMRERHRLGIERYGTPLTHDNGRDHLVDAYQEILDGMVYLAADLMKRGLPIVYDGKGLLDDVQVQLERMRRTAVDVRWLIYLRTPVEGP